MRENALQVRTAGSFPKRAKYFFIDILLKIITVCYMVAKTPECVNESENSRFFVGVKK